MKKKERGSLKHYSCWRGSVNGEIKKKGSYKYSGVYGSMLKQKDEFVTRVLTLDGFGKRDKGL